MMTNFNDTITINFSQKITKNIPDSIQKVMLIDIPTSLTNDFLLKSFPKTDSLANLAIAASVSYHLRSEIKLFLMQEVGLDKYSSGIIAGLIGGYVRYKLTEQVPLIGAINNALYETCNNFDFCGNSMIASIVFTISVEALDAVAQAWYISTAEKDILKSYLSIVMKGAKIGSIVSTFVYGGYVPVVTNDFTYLDHLSESISFGGETKLSEEL